MGVIEDLKLEEGRLTIAGGKERYIIIPLRAYGAIYESARKLIGDYSAGFLYYIGLEIGKGLEEEIKRRMSEAGESHSDAHAMLKQFAQFMTELGFGKVELVEFKDSEAIVRMHENATTELIKNADKPVCHIERGMIAGAVEAVTGRRVMAREVKCRAKGDPYCEFHIKIL